jgi:hypothetical protein
LISAFANPRLEVQMRQLWFTVLASHLRHVISSLVTFFGVSWDRPAMKYRPEDHYMRGPGPKWREKHFPDRVSANGTSVVP